MNIHLEGITLLHWLLAFAGLMLHLLMKLEKARKLPGFTFGKFFSENIISSICSALIIPICMIVCNDPAVATMVPITNATALLVGYQSRSFFKAIMDMAKKKKPTAEDSE